MNRHEPTDECDGKGAIEWAGLPVICVECETHLCPCGLTYGHDCE